jgi:DNA polymerase IV (DinB-like DNA polymerase)
MRIILHVDMDCFFAQVEEREDPSIKGRPVIVGSDPKEGKGRGVVATCNYEARSFGIHSAMPISIAYKKCPNAVFLPPHMKLYKEASMAVMDIFRSYADKFQQVSIDEAYLDVSKIESFEDAKILAQKIKQEVLEKEKLTCSVGIGPNKLVAKIAANENKPDGLTLILPDEVHSFLDPKPVRALHGIGPKSAERLNSLGIETVKDLRETKHEIGEELRRMAFGADNREVKEDYTRKSIGRQHTFERDTDDKKRIMDAIDDMIRIVYRHFLRHEFLYKTITLKVRYSNFSTHTKSKTLDDYSDSIKKIRQVVVEELPAFLDGRKVRLVGVSIHSFIDRKALKQCTLEKSYETKLDSYL